jgi:hypothetical protein
MAKFRGDTSFNFGANTRPKKGKKKGKGKGRRRRGAAEGSLK